MKCWKHLSPARQATNICNTRVLPTGGLQLPDGYVRSEAELLQSIAAPVPGKFTTSSSIHTGDGLLCRNHEESPRELQLGCCLISNGCRSKSDLQMHTMCSWVWSLPGPLTSHSGRPQQGESMICGEDTM